MWRSNRGSTLCHVYGDVNNESNKLFWDIRKDKVGMINNSAPIPRVISCTDKVMRREIVELYKSHRHTSNSNGNVKIAFSD